jgi:hypothetical protein
VRVPPLPNALQRFAHIRDRHVAHRRIHSPLARAEGSPVVAGRRGAITARVRQRMYAYASRGRDLLLGLWQSRMLRA